MFRAVRAPLLIIVLIALLLAGLWFWIRTSLPDLSGSQALPGLARGVEITRDRQGVPHIEAESQEDLYYALGFVHAQDRLWQMEYRRLRATGRLAELLGEEALKDDLLIRTLGLRQAAERDLSLLSARARGALQAYCDGVNAFLERRTGALPLEFQLLGHGPESWSPIDVALQQKLTSWEWARPVEAELLHARLADRLSQEELGELLDDASPPVSAELYGQLPLAELGGLLTRGLSEVRGSRAWALAGEHSVNDAPLLAVESYGPLTAPAPWYLVELRAPGLMAAGATLPGMPLILSGRNERAAWALVPTPADNQDLYLERVDPSGNGSGTYLTEDGPQEFETRRVSVLVRGGDEVTFTVRRSRHGPIVSDLVDSDGETDGDQELALALRWTALEEGDRTLQSALDMASAGSWAEMRTALRGLDEFHGTLLYADDQGSIGEQQVGRLPERGNGSRGNFPLPGWSSDSAWSGWIPANRLDSSLDPASGTIVVAEAGEETTERLLNTLDSHTVESTAALLGREHLAPAEQFLAVVRSAVPSGDLERRAHAQLLGWSGGLEGESSAPLIFSAWYSALGQALLGDELGDDLAVASLRHPALLQRAIESGGWCDDRRTDEVEGCEEITSLALTNAVAAVAQEHGRQPAEWPTHELARPSYRHPVFDGTVLAPLFRVTPSEDGEQADGAVAAGPTYRAVYELRASQESEERWTSSGFLIPTGQSGNPLSPYFRNLAERWPEVELLTLGGVEAEEGERLVLEPRR